MSDFEVRFWVQEDTASEEVELGAGVVYACTRAYEPGNNQDALMVAKLDGARALLAVADGAGGLPSGGQAAEFAVRVLAQSVERALAQDQSVRDGVLTGFDEANAAIQSLGSGAATTLVVAELDGRTLRTYHAGDSTLLVTGQRKKIKLVTMAHSPVGYAVEAGYLSEDEAMHHEERHLVSNLLGSPAMRIEVGTATELAALDTVVLGSDGLFDNLQSDEIAARVCAGKLQHVAECLARDVATRMHEPREGQPSKPDDLGFLVYRPRPAKSA